MYVMKSLASQQASACRLYLQYVPKLLIRPSRLLKPPYSSLQHLCRPNAELDLHSFR